VETAAAAYFARDIQPLLGRPDVKFIGEIGDRDKAEFLGSARALLFPIGWPEPFGLVMIEAMACGTPVIAWRCGSVPEIVEDGITGFVVASEDEAVSAVSRMGTLDRATIRGVFERRFASTVMAGNYVDVYRRLTDNVSRAAAMAAASK